VKRVTKPGYPTDDKPSNWVRQGGSTSATAAPRSGPVNAGVQAVEDLAIIDAEVDSTDSPQGHA
jgi:hypothetical protein